jgi:hypothetical protein
MLCKVGNLRSIALCSDALRHDIRDYRIFCEVETRVFSDTPVQTVFDPIIAALKAAMTLLCHVVEESCRDSRRRIG